MKPLFAGIKSRPLYTGVAIDHAASHHIWAVEGGGVSKLRAILTGDATHLLAASTILVTGDQAAATCEFYHQKQADSCHHMQTVQNLVTRLAVMLSTARMGLRLYVLGSEDFIGQVAATAQRQGIDFDDMRTEQCGSLARLVQCVHCKGMIDHVTTNIVPCPHCGIQLFVRDHYSRRLGAFQGVAVNAEDPSAIPTIEEIYK
ncbi:MAG: dimethylamine monooxygenase subunit DmmA family protein [Candidatus Symbiobacter sp.]|nr:dimethylamine monooxygenase subunit DmmA family protein [Candidatus Symbiobacter sp.]